MISTPTPTEIDRDSEKPFAYSQEYHRCWPYLEAALAPAALTLPDGALLPSHTKGDIWTRILKRQAFFWAGNNCALITELITNPTGLKSHHIWLAGGDLDEIVAMVEPHVENFGRQHACHQQTGNGRRGWLRKFHGYEEIGVRKRKTLLTP